MKIILDIVCFLFGVVAGVMSVVSGNIVAASFFIATNIKTGDVLSVPSDCYMEIKTLSRASS